MRRTRGGSVGSRRQHKSGQGVVSHGALDRIEDIVTDAKNASESVFCTERRKQNLSVHRKEKTEEKSVRASEDALSLACL